VTVASSDNAPGIDETAKGEGSAVQLIIAGAVLSLGESFQLTP
jgi:hypothetical protein